MYDTIDRGRYETGEATFSVLKKLKILVWKIGVGAPAIFSKITKEKPFFLFCFSQRPFIFKKLDMKSRPKKQTEFSKSVITPKFGHLPNNLLCTHFFFHFISSINCPLRVQAQLWCTEVVDRGLLSVLMPTAMTPVRSSMAEVLLCLKRDSSESIGDTPETLPMGRSISNEFQVS
jgi:hypothetical protein